MTIEVRLFSDRLDPEFIWTFESLTEAFKISNRELNRGGSIYYATIHQPGETFICRYWTGAEILDIPGPWYLTRTQASHLHTVRGKLRGLPHEFAGDSILMPRTYPGVERRGATRRHGERRAKGEKT